MAGGGLGECPRAKMCGNFFDLSIKIVIVHALLAVAILLVQRAERADSLGMAGG